MGTSVRKTSKRIKELLENTLQENPQVTIEIIVPKVASEVIKAGKTKKYFDDKDFSILVGGGLSCFRKIASVGYNDFVREYGYNPETISVIEIQKIIETILDNIEKENEDIQSSFILNAFKLVMTNVLMAKVASPFVFLRQFCEVFLDMIIREEISEELSSAFKEIAPDKLDDSISQFIEVYIEENFNDCIKKCVDNEINITELIVELQKRLK